MSFARISPSIMLKLAWYLASALGDPLKSPVRSNSADSPIQNSVLRSDQTWHVDWTPETGLDLVVLGHDRKSSSIVGYQKSTGKVFSQRQSTGMGGSRMMHLTPPLSYKCPNQTKRNRLRTVQY